MARSGRLCRYRTGIFSVTVTASPAVPLKPTVDEVDDPVVGVEHAYCEYSEGHHAYAIFKDRGCKLLVLVLKDPDKLP